jgi:hypothetical protein
MAWNLERNISNPAHFSTATLIIINKYEITKIFHAQKQKNIL